MDSGAATNPAVQPDRNFSKRFREGTRLRYPICDDQGVMLLNAGVELTPNLVSLLDRRGIRLRLNAMLEVIEGGIVGMQVPITHSTVKIGRNKDCHIRLCSPMVSGNHCFVEKLPLSLWVDDLKSTNGTWVNTVRIEKPVELKDGDLIKFGDFTVKVHLDAVLQGDGQNAHEVAQLILADKRGNVEMPIGAKTLIANDAMARELKEALRVKGL